LAREKGEDAHLVVDQEENGSRLDRLILRRLGPSFRILAMRLIRRGNVRINGKRARPEARLQQGDKIFLPVSLRRGNGNNSPGSRDDFRSGLRASRGPAAKIPVLFEDADILVIDKPAGVVVHGGSGHETGLIEHLRASLHAPELRLAHRLDRDTSGCLLMAKRLSTLRALATSFRERSTHKTYLAWVAGHPYPCAGRFQSKLVKGVLHGGERMVVSGTGGKSAVTDYQVSMLVERDGWAFSLLALQPESGRTHQLRVQLQAAGHAILGDGKYGLREDNRYYRAMGGRGMALHAWRLRFRHPVQGRMVEVRAPWPESWAVFSHGI